jgi:Gnt-I system high-affinity gluconate transporter
MTPPPGMYEPREIDPATLPGLTVSVLTTLTPVILMLVGAVIDIAFGTAALDPFRAGTNFRAQLATAVPDQTLRGVVLAGKFLGNANVALMGGVLVGLYTLGIRRGRTMEELMRVLARSGGSIAPILLVIAAGGAFSQVLRDGGVAEYVKQLAMGMHASPLLLAFGVASALRLAVGSATVATMTTAGVMAPIAAASGVSPELMVDADDVERDGDHRRDGGAGDGAAAQPRDVSPVPSSRAARRTSRGVWPHRRSFAPLRMTTTAAR